MKCFIYLYKRPPHPQFLPFSWAALGQKAALSGSCSLCPAEEPALTQLPLCPRAVPAENPEGHSLELRETEILPFVQKVGALPSNALSCPWWTGKWVFKALTLSSALFFFPSTFWMFSLGISGPLMDLFFPVSHHKSCTFILMFGKKF